MGESDVSPESLSIQGAPSDVGAVVFRTKAETLIFRITHYLTERFKISGTQILVAFALAIGIATGVGSAIFRTLTEYLHHMNFAHLEDGSSWISRLYIIPIPVIGIVITAIIVDRFCGEAKGHGVPEVMQAVAINGGRIRSRVSGIKTVVSALTIGFGGSAGMEGPIVQIGASVGSSLGQGMKMSADRTRTMVACGSAAGIAAIFNAPIAGVIFALEVILGNFTANAFSLVVLSSVASSVTSHLLMGDKPVFNLPSYELHGTSELPFYMALGLGAAFVAKFFVASLYWMEDFFDDWKWPVWAKAIVGGLAMGVIGAVMYQVLGGFGYKTIEAAALGRLSVGLMLGLLVVKLLATCITLSCGGSGGVFAPALFMGAMFGGVFGYCVNLLLPDLQIEMGAFAIVGMSAVFAAAAHAPITSILMIFEMTSNYDIILPLMLATVISMIVANQILPESVYTKKLMRRGVNVKKGLNQDIMSRIPVDAAMTTDLETVTDDITVRKVARRMVESEHTGYPVLNKEGELVNIITYSDVHHLRDSGLLHVPIANLKPKKLIVAYPDETLRDALSRMTLRDVGRLPVVDRNDTKKLLGIITRTNILKAYQKANILEDDAGQFKVGV